MSIKQFCKNWSLPIAIVLGILSYLFAQLIYSFIPNEFLPSRYLVIDVIAIVQPLLISIMLFVSFLKIKISELRPSIWGWWLLLIQGLIFVILGCYLWQIPETESRILIESAMLAMICPTATASAVIVRKLSGNVAHTMSYTILINIVASILIPSVVPFAHPVADYSFFKAFTLIMIKVMPMLVFPLFLAALVRKYMPKILAKITSIPDLAFYFWLVSLPLAMAVSTRIIMHTNIDLFSISMIALISLICCLVQFGIGRVIGNKYQDAIACTQAMGQKTLYL